MRHYITIFIAFAVPLVAKLTHTELYSLSSMVYHDNIFWMFLIMAASAMLLMASYEKWRVPALLLGGVAVFDTERFPTLHDVLAVGFFLSCLWALYQRKRFRYYAYIFAASAPLYFISLYLMETLGIYIICAYHIHILKYVKK